MGHEDESKPKREAGKRGVVWPIVIGLIFTLLFVGNAIHRIGYSPDVKQSITIGQPARDGQFEFIVKSLDCSKNRLENDYLYVDATGKFCVASMSVENVGDEPRTLSADAQELFDASNREFKASSGATEYVTDNDYTDINPGSKVDFAVAFDVSKDVTPKFITLHDDAASNGVSILLKQQ